MATTISQLAQQAEQETLERVTSTHQQVVKTAGAVIRPGERLVAKGPKVPLSAGLPTAEEAVDTAFRFTIQLVEVQRSFAAGLLATASPITRKLTGQPSEAATTRTAASARKAAPARKTASRSRNTAASPRKTAAKHA
jgi:hypothetical protein